MWMTALPRGVLAASAPRPGLRPFFEPADGQRLRRHACLSKNLGALSSSRPSKAIDAANNTEFGLASYFYSRDIGRIFRVGEALEYGMVGVNVGILATEHVPFGGVKQSGLGREGSHHGMDDYVEIKYLCLGDIQQ